MNILILSWRSPGHPNAGGAEQVTFEHAKSWVEAGHRVVWFSSFFAGGKIQENKDGVTIIRRGDYLFGVRFFAVLWYFFGKHPKFDLVVDEFHGIPFFTPFFVKGRKLAFIHEVAREVWKLNPWRKPLGWIPSFFGPILEPVFFRFYKNVPFMTVSESTRADLISLGISKRNITIIKSGIKVILPKKLPPKDARYTALYLGAISKDKGIEDALRVFAEIERKDDNWQYWIAGRGDEEYVRRLKKSVKELGIGKKLKYWGYVSEKVKFRLLARAHVLINPSIHEGWGLVNIEANAVGTPVVGYNVHGLRDSVISGKTGILVEKGNFRALAENTLRLVRNDEVYAGFRANALDWASKFSWDKAKRKSLELIESL